MDLVKVNWASTEDLKILRGIVYRIYCIKTNKNYIGKARGSFFRRYSMTNEPEKYDTNQLIKKDIIKYGWENFRVQILHNDIKSDESLLFLEAYYEKLYNSHIPISYSFIMECLRTGGKAKGWTIQRLIKNNSGGN